MSNTVNGFALLAVNHADRAHQLLDTGGPDVRLQGIGFVLLAINANLARLVKLVEDEMA